MASQPLAFAEILAGGVLATAAFNNIPLGEFLKKGMNGAKRVAKGPSSGEEAQTSGGKGAPGGQTQGGASNPGSGADPETEPGEQAAKEHPGQTAPPPGNAAAEVLKSTEKNLEHYLKRPLTKKETSELKSLQSKGEL